MRLVAQFAVHAAVEHAGGHAPRPREFAIWNGRVAALIVTMAAPAIVDCETVCLAARDGKVVARKTIVSVRNLSMQLARCVTIGAADRGGWPAVNIDPVTLEAGDRLPGPPVLPMALSIGHLLRVRPRRVTRHTGRFVQRSVTRNVRLNTE